MFRTEFDKYLDSATSHLQLEPPVQAIIGICDHINQKDTNPKAAFAAIKKKMNSPNPHTAYFALLVLESVVKNCGSPMHDVVFTKENCTMFSQLLETTHHENVRSKMLGLIQTWAWAFRNSDKYQAIKDTMTILKTKGLTFPELQEADAMFTMDIAPKWAGGKKCHRCRDEFSITNRRHHCRNCGQSFCGQCSSKFCPLPKFGIEKDVRVCDGCFAQLQRPSSAKVATARTAESDLPVEYLTSSLAQQVQTPPRKTDQELKEEEELQLALALSQSEAESVKQQQQQHSLTAAAYRLQQRSPSPEASPASKDPQIEETHPDLAKYLDRSYWEQRKVSDSPMASPSAPSPMPPTPQPQQNSQQQILLTANDFRPKSTEEEKIDEFAANMRTQVEIFVNRMKSNSSRGRSISNDSSVQTLFMTLTGLHSQQLSYIKELDDKRMWYEQLQDKLAQIKDSRAALDDLRHEHAEKLRRLAEEQELQRQIQMAQKLEIMRKKKQEYLQYQRQLALHRIQEQEREMQMRQEQQMAQYRMNQTAFPFMPNMAGAPLQGQQMSGVYNPYSPNPTTVGAGVAGMSPFTTQAGMAGVLPERYNRNMIAQPQQPSQMILQQPPINQQLSNPINNIISSAEQQQQQQQQQADGGQHQQPSTTQQQQHMPQHQQPQLAHVMLQQQTVMRGQSPIAYIGNSSTQSAAIAPLQQVAPTTMNQAPPHAQQIQPNASSQASSQIQAVQSAPAPPQNDPEPAAPSAAEEPATAELISFD